MMNIKENDEYKIEIHRHLISLNQLIAQHLFLLFSLSALTTLIDLLLYHFYVSLSVSHNR
jgi:hypothetical protein